MARILLHGAYLRLGARPRHDDRDALVAPPSPIDAFYKDVLVASRAVGRTQSTTRGAAGTTEAAPNPV